MTGPEHYQMAETLLEVAVEASTAGESYRQDTAVMAALAQAHATLALAAATDLHRALAGGQS
jgi:hypothetical protein